MGVKPVYSAVLQDQDAVGVLDAGDSLGDDELGGSRINVRKAWRMLASVAVSTALVESSRMRIFGFLSRALAMQRRCFWPPETLAPPRSIQVL